MSTPILELNDWHDQKESMDEHILRVAATYIRLHGKDCKILFGAPQDTDTMNPAEFADYLDEHASGMRQDRMDREEKEKTNMEFIGTIIQAGGDSNDPTVTIITTKDQLRKQANIPFFRRCEIQITPI